METTTATALIKSMTQATRANAIHRLLYELKRFVGVYPRNEHTPLPDHDVVWLTDVDGGPGRAISDALKATPLLWWDALPEDVCVVPKKMLESAGISLAAIESMRHAGASMVETRGRYFLDDLEQIRARPNPVNHIKIKEGAEE